MIADCIDNWRIYPFGKAWATAFSFLEKLTPEVAEGEYRLEGEDIFARVMTYETRNRSSAVLEAHRHYVDIQAVISGREGMEWHPMGTLVPDKSYDEKSDAEFYRHPNLQAGMIEVFPGRFAVFFPGDAHMPCLAVSRSPTRVKKIVVKIRTILLFPGLNPEASVNGV